jgi:hypothetical protein
MAITPRSTTYALPLPHHSRLRVRKEGPTSSVYTEVLVSHQAARYYANVPHAPRHKFIPFTIDIYSTIHFWKTFGMLFDGHLSVPAARSTVLWDKIVVSVTVGRAFCPYLHFLL